jgi:CheY-like chemotaxis protein
VKIVAEDPSDINNHNNRISFNRQGMFIIQLSSDEDNTNNINNNLNLSQNHNHNPHLRNLLLLTELLTLQQQQQQILRSHSKRVLIVDDNPDITLTFKEGLEAENDKSGNNTFWKVYTYNDTILALAEFKPNFYDLLLVDINMPKMNGFEFSRQILEIDVNVRVCYITAAEINLQALREQFPTLSIGCFVKKPIGVEDLVRRVKAEVE